MNVCELIFESFDECVHVVFAHDQISMHRMKEKCITCVKIDIHDVLWLSEKTRLIDVCSSSKTFYSFTEFIINSSVVRLIVETSAPPPLIT